MLAVISFVGSWYVVVRFANLQESCHLQIFQDVWINTFPGFGNCTGCLRSYILQRWQLLFQFLEFFSGQPVRTLFRKKALQDFSTSTFSLFYALLAGHFTATQGRLPQSSCQSHVLQKGAEKLHMLLQVLPATSTSGKDIQILHMESSSAEEHHISHISWFSTQPVSLHLWWHATIRQAYTWFMSGKLAISDHISRWTIGIVATELWSKPVAIRLAYIWKVVTHGNSL